MKITITLIMILLILTGDACAQSQMEINNHAANDAMKIGKKIEKTIAILEATAKGNGEFIHKLKTSQQLWEKFIDAHIDAVFPVAPNEELRMKYGSICNYCMSLYDRQLDSYRLKELTNWYKLPQHIDKAKVLAEYKSADKKLNSIYKQAIESDDDPYFKKNMIKAEESWIAFRDADAQAYSACVKDSEGCTQKLTQLTQDRIKQLQRWTVGAEDDGCTGTYMTKAK